METIEKLWEGLKKPIIDEFSFKRYNNTNLYVIKNKKNNFGLLISDEKGILEKEYKNILVLNNKSIVGLELEKNNCLIILNKDNISSLTFSKAISVYFEDIAKDIYTKIDIQLALDRVEEITKNLKKRFNEIVGVWGELYILKLILKHNEAKENNEIITSWESPNGRSIIDFNFRELNTCIEVKTTLKQEREHHISNYSQVNPIMTSEGFLASILINEDSKGDSCYDLLEDINGMLKDEDKFTFLKRIKIRGKSICQDKNYFFKTRNNGLLFVKLEDVPKPIFSNNVFNMKWDFILDNEKSIPFDFLIKRFKP